MSFVDDRTKFVSYFPIRNKVEFYSTHIVFEKMNLMQFGLKIKIFHSDGSGEFKFKKLRKPFEENDTLHQFTCLYTPRQAGVIERRHRSIVQIGLTQLFHAKLPLYYWNESFQTAVLILFNRLPTKTLKDKLSPYTCLF